MIIKSRGPGPPKSMRGWISILTFMFFLFETAFSEGNKIYDMQTLCEDRFRQALYRKIEGAYLKSQNERNLDCIVTFQTHSILQRFMLRFDLLQLDCNDHLFIYDGAHAVDSYKMNNLHDEPWSMTVTTITHVEVLKIFKEDFQRILEKFLGNQRGEITQCLNDFFYFKDWDQRTIVESCVLAKIVHYKKDEIILGDTCDNYDNSFFIISGSCRVIYHLKILHIPRKHHTELRIFNSSEADDFPASYLFRKLDMPKRRKIQDPPIAGLIVDALLTKFINKLPLVEPKTSNTEEKPIVQYVQSHFFKIVEMLPGACFGVGESLENKFILAESPSVKLLRIPRYFLKSHDSGNIWEKVIEMYKTTYPSAKAIFNQFLTDRQWNRSKKKYMESLLSAERPFTGVTNSETPFYLRITMDFENPIFRKIKKVINE